MSLRTGFGVLAAAAAAFLAMPASGQLDDIEAGICRESFGLQRAVAAAQQVRRETVPVEQLAGPVDDAQRRAYLQRQLDNQLGATQDAMVESTRRDLARYQAQYRQLTGTNFDTAQCDGGSVRVTHAMREQQQRERDMQSQTNRMQQALAADEAARQALVARSQACDAKRALDIPPEAAARLFPPGHLEESRRIYGDFVSAYQREHGTPFDPASCR